MRKYRGFEGEVSTLGILRTPGTEYQLPDQYRYVAPQVTAAPAPTGQVSPLQPPPVMYVPPSPPAGWYDPPPVILPPPVPGTGPVDTMQPDIFTDDFVPLSPVSIAPRGTGPAGTPAGAGIVIPDESVAFPYGTNGDKGIVAKAAPQNVGLILAAIAAFFLLGG